MSARINRSGTPVGDAAGSGGGAVSLPEPYLPKKDRYEPEPVFVQLIVDPAV